MGAIFNEFLIFPQENGPDVELVVNGDEFYARYEDLEGFTVVYDADLGLFCYADVLDGQFISTGTPLTKQPPAGLARHLKESPEVRNSKFGQRYELLRPKVARPPRTSSGRWARRAASCGPPPQLRDGPRPDCASRVRDLQSTVTAADVNAMLNGPDYTANGNFCSVRDYFLDGLERKARLLEHGGWAGSPLEDQAFYKETSS